MKKLIIRFVAAAAVFAAVILWAIADNKPSLERAQKLLASGVVSRADVKSALLKKQGDSVKSVFLKTSFKTGTGEIIERSYSAPTDLLAALTDPKKPSELRPDASVDVVYMPDNVKESELKAVLDQKIDNASNVLLYALIGGIPALLVFFVLGFIPALRLRERKQ